MLFGLISVEREGA